MSSFEAKRVINGTHGAVWFNGSLVAEATGLEAKVKLNKADVPICGRMSKQQKVTDYEGSGTVKLNKVTSRFLKLLNDDMKACKQTPVTIISKLADPDSYGAERVVLKDCIFDEMTLANWEAKKLGEESIPFTFTDWDLLDTIDPAVVGE